MEPIQEVKGGDLIEFGARITGYAPSKEEHASLISSLKKQSITVEKELKQKKKLQKKINTDILMLNNQLKNIDDQITKSQKVVRAILGGRRSKKLRTTKRKTSKNTTR